MCGLNGAWLGEGFKFRTLDLKGGYNEANLKIVGFRQDSEPLEADVAGDELSGKTQSGALLTGAALIGAAFYLERGHSTGTYKLEIVGIERKRFWTRCLPGATGCVERPREVPFYRFYVTDGRGCKVQLCRPGLSEEDDDAISGTAVIFRGDLYTDSYEVRTADSNPPLKIEAAEEGVFNIACIGTAISKLHLLRHTEAARDGSHRTSRAQRQALLRMLTADYCGIGYPFTRDGHPLDLAFKKTSWDAGPAYDIRDAITLEAHWDENGATCLDTPRLESLDLGGGVLGSRLRTRIDAVCKRNRHMLPSCPQGHNGQPLGSAMLPGDYAVSGNPPKEQQ